MYAPRFICLTLCCVALAMAVRADGAQRTREHVRYQDRLSHIDSLRDSSGVMLYRVQCADIIVRLRNGAWFQNDSSLFFSERLKVEWASTILKSQVDHLRDSLHTLADSAGGYINRGLFTRSSFDSTLVTLQASLENTVNTHNYSLRRLEDYQTVLNAVRPLLHRADSR